MQEGQTGKEEMRQQQRMKAMTDMTKKIKSKGRMDAHNSWWVSELLAADGERAWLNPKEEETMQKWYAADCKKKCLHPEWEDAVL